MNAKRIDNSSIDQTIKDIHLRNEQLMEELLAIRMANKEVLSKTSTDQVS